MSFSLRSVTETEDQEAKDTGVRVRRWTVDEFFRAVKLGLFKHPERLELIHGEVVERMAAQNDPHFTCVRACTRALERAFGPGFEVRPQGPFRLSEQDYTEPDVLVVTGTYLDYVDHGPAPSDARLLAEVSDTTLHQDRSKKAALYARHGIGDYWIVNLVERCVEVCRDPQPMPESRYGHGYRSRVRCAENETVSPLAAPQSSVRIADLLPRPALTETDGG